MHPPLLCGGTAQCGGTALGMIMLLCVLERFDYLSSRFDIRRNMKCLGSVIVVMTLFLRLQGISVAARDRGPCVG